MICRKLLNGSPLMAYALLQGGIRKGAAGYNITFVHPKGNDGFPTSGEGVLIELVQTPPEVIAGLSS